MATYVEEVLADTPLAYWRLGETTGTTANDATANARNGTYSGTYTLAQTGAITGDGDPSARFNNLPGGPSIVTVTNGSWMDLNVSWSFEFWIKLASDPSASTFPGVFRRGSGAVNGKYIVYYNSSRQLNMTRDTTTNRFTVTPAVIPASAADTWSHYVITYDQPTTTLKMFENGTENVAARVTSMTTLTSTVNTDVTIGRGDTAPHGDHWLDEAAIYDVALSSARILAHYNASGVALPKGNRLRRWQY